MAANETPRKKQRFLIVVLVSIILVLLLAAGYFFLMGNEERVFGFGEEPQEVHIPLEEFLVNSKNSGMVRLEVTLGSFDEQAEDIALEEQSKIRDAINHVIVGRPQEEMFATTENDEFLLKQEIKERINQSLGREFVEEIYITNILVQN